MKTDLQKQLSQVADVDALIIRLVKIETKIQQLKTDIKREEYILKNLKEYGVEDQRKIAGNYASEASDLQTSQGRYFKLLTDLKNFQKEYSQLENINNQWDTQYNQILKTLSDTCLKEEGVNFTEANDKLKETIINKNTAFTIFQNKLKELKLSEEDIKDAQNAQEFFTIKQNELAELETSQVLLEEYLKMLPINTAEAGKKDYLSTLQALLSSEYKALKETSERVKEIDLIVGLNEGTAWDSFLDFIIQEVKLCNPERRLVREIIGTFLRDHLDDMLGNYDLFLTAFAKPPNQNIEFLQKTFLTPRFHMRACYKYYSYFSDILSFSKINITYDQRDLNQSSFGQRCTAILMIILSKGNAPIIIDEPEGHLDSPLIANEIVGLLKIVKKTRQVILATHNANIVINGDAELINIVSIDQNAKTHIQPACIEDLRWRKELLALEGGSDAFKMRENKIIKGFQSPPSFF